MSKLLDVPLIMPESLATAVDSEAQPPRHPPIYTARVDLARRDEVLRILQEARLRDERRATSRDDEQQD
jgi:hypothetical protein